MSQQKSDISHSAIKTFSSLFSNRSSTANHKSVNQPNTQAQMQTKSQTKTETKIPMQKTSNTSISPKTITVNNHPTDQTVKPNGTQSNGDQHRSNRPKKPEFKLVDVVISGVTYPIQCPTDEINTLQKASVFINQFISDIRKQAPTLSHENLLVLCCLNLYEQIDSQQLQHKHNQLENERIQALINKISQDAQSILPH